MSTSDDWAHLFWKNVDKRSDSECWEWTGIKLPPPGNYGMLRIDGKNQRANRLSWRLHFGEIPDGFYVCHYCDNPPCVNPVHLFLGTASDNTMDSIAKGRQTKGNPPKLAGEDHPRSKLTAEQVLQIRRSWTGLSYKSLASSFGISRQTIRDIITRRSWTHI